MKSVKVSECVFADDIAIVADTEQSLQYNVDLWAKELDKQGMKINTNKTKVVVITNKIKRDIRIKINNQTVEQVKSLKYLGITIEETGKQDEEINNRIATATKIFHSMKRGFISKPEISEKTKMSIYKTIYLPTLLYGCETWVLKEIQLKKIQAVEMKYLRKVAKVTIMDKIRNDEIRNRLKTESVKKIIERAQLRWWGHMKRLNEERQVRKIWEAKSIGKRKKGRPKKTWDGEVAKIIKARGISWKQAGIIARDRDRWRAVIK